MSIVQFPEPEVLELQFPVSAEMEAALSVLDVIGKTGLAPVPFTLQFCGIPRWV